MFDYLKKYVSRTLRGRGYVLAPEWKVEHLGLIKHLSIVFETCGVDCVLDVGANTGQYRDLVRKEIGFKGPIVSFEPIPENVSALCRRAQNDANWHIHGYALGAASGDMAFNVMSDTTLSSFRTPTTSTPGAHLRQNVVERVETVHVATLDSVLPAIRDEYKVSRFFLKIDTQGFDLEVVRGASKSLKDIILLQTEASIVPIYDGMPDYKTVMAELDKLGYVVSGMFPVTPLGSLRLIEVDCLMIRRDAIERNRQVVRELGA